MQRIPNPVSDPAIFIRTFRAIYGVLKSQSTFTLDDVSRAMIVSNSVTSQGAIGEEALRRSTRKDRSRDPIYNQSKMYAELFRTLGWIQSGSSKLTFSFSFLGDHLASASDPNPLMRECLLGIAYPNEVLGVMTDQKVRVIGSILLAMDTLGTISRDELMAGPMSIADDTDQQTFEKMLRTLSDCRRKPGTLDQIIDRIAAQRGISRSPTMENYTRFPIAVFPWSGWAIKQSPGVLAITQEGRVIAARLRAGNDVRLEGFNKIPAEAKPAFVRWTFYKMLERSRFDIAGLSSEIEVEAQMLRKQGMLFEGDVYFSPFQQLSRDTITRLCPDLIAIDQGKDTESRESLIKVFGASTTPKRERMVLKYQTGEAVPGITDGTRIIAQDIQAAFDAHNKNVIEAVEALAKKYGVANQDIFYPLVANLFCLLGFNCQASRRGVNYARADAMIIDTVDSIPIEIKSPGEETEISVKAVRQALENKIVLLSRKSYETRPDTTTLVVGFNAPNDRSEVHELIEDIAKAFAVRIGVIDFRSLLALCLETIVGGKKLDLINFRSLQGVIRV